MKTLLIATLCTAVLIAMSCNNAVEYTADELTVSGLAGQPGYAWFNQEVAAYTPTVANINAIKAQYAAQPFNTLIYVNPSCTCNGTQKHFPRLYSTLKAAGIPDSSITIYSMHNAATKQPYSAQYPVTALPTFYFINGSAYTRKLEPPSDTAFHVDSIMVSTLK